MESNLDSLTNSIEDVASSIPTLPNYIKETYIDSTEIRSPNIS
jgi:hypothetical protein